jgi:hypothetical protein
MNEPQPVSPRARLQELQAIPENQRTEAQWDELNELEIMLAPGNREGAPTQNTRQPASAPAGHAKPNNGRQGKNPSKKFHRRFRKGGAPGGG